MSLNKFRLPPRNAISWREIIAISRCLFHYKRLGLDPGYDDYYENLYTKNFSIFMGGGYSDAVSSGCASLYIAIKALKLPLGSLIATSPVTDASVIGAITEQGHIPYLIDSKKMSYNSTVNQLAERYRPDLRCFVLTHAGGEPAEIGPIIDYCKEKNIEVVEDCSQAVGAIPEGQSKPVGSYGRFGCFSTMYRKNLSASGSSGMIFSTNQDDFRLAKQHADRGKKWWDKSLVDMRDPGYAEFPGLNWNSDELRCAIGLANLQRISDTLQKRRYFLRALIDHIKEEGIKLFIPSNFHNGFSPFYFPIFIDSRYTNKSVLEISEKVKSLGTGIGVKYGCLVSTWRWAKPYLFDKFSAPNALQARDQCFHLYLNENYSLREVDFIVENLKKVESQSVI